MDYQSSSKDRSLGNILFPVAPLIAEGPDKVTKPWISTGKVSKKEGLHSDWKKPVKGEFSLVSSLTRALSVLTHSLDYTQVTSNLKPNSSPAPTSKKFRSRFPIPRRIALLKNLDRSLKRRVSTKTLVHHLPLSLLLERSHRRTIRVRRIRLLELLKSTRTSPRTGSNRSISRGLVLFSARTRFERGLL